MLYKNCTQNLAYNKCLAVCSIPPLYQSTLFQYFIASIPAKLSLLWASIYLKKYHEDPAHCGIVSVSRFASLPHLGHLQLTNSSILARGLSPVSVGTYSVTSGSNTGKSSSGTATHPQESQ